MFLRGNFTYLLYESQFQRSSTVTHNDTLNIDSRNYSQIWKGCLGRMVNSTVAHPTSINNIYRDSFLDGNTQTLSYSRTDGSLVSKVEKCMVGNSHGNGV